MLHVRVDYLWVADRKQLVFKRAAKKKPFGSRHCLQSNIGSDRSPRADWKPTYLPMCNNTENRNELDLWNENEPKPRCSAWKVDKVWLKNCSSACWDPLRICISSCSAFTWTLQLHLCHFLITTRLAFHTQIDDVQLSIGILRGQ